MLKLLVTCFLLVRCSNSWYRSLLIPWYTNFNFLYLEVILNQQLVHGNLTQRMAVFLPIKQNSSVSLNDLKPVFYLEDNLSTDSCILFNCLYLLSFIPFHPPTTISHTGDYHYKPQAGSKEKPLSYTLHILKYE